MRKLDPPKLPFPPLARVPLVERPGIDPSVTRYGDYDRRTGEYVIHRPDTPQPWYNYLTNGTFTSFISNTAGGTCFCDDAENRRVLRTHLHSRPIDHPGRWIYLRDAESGAFWSASWAPTYPSLSDYRYECRVGPGYTVIRSGFRGVETCTTYFVAPGANVEVWSFEVENASARRRSLQVFPYAEFILWSPGRDGNLDAALKCTDVVAGRRVVIHRSLYDFEGRALDWKAQYAFLAASASPAALDTLMEAFVGGYRGYDRPRAVENGACSGYVNRGGRPCAAFQFDVALGPGRKRRLDFVLGYATSEKQAKAMARSCTKGPWVDAQLARLKRHWRAYLGRFRVRTGDPAVDVPFNGFSAVQVATTFRLSRSLSPYQLAGSRGLGFRDSIQDTLGAIPREPARARALIEALLQVQYPEGDACHTFYPARGEGTGRGYSDDHLWPALAVASYVRETGDVAFLDKVLGYWASREAGTVLDHLERAFRFGERHVGKHGLPLLGYADWNDCLNAYPGAESVFTACLTCHAARTVGEMLEAIGETKGARRMARRYRTMAGRINRHAWDGRWYVRLILKDGRRVGSGRNRYGRIFIESNVWAVMSGVAGAGRAETAMDSVRRHLGTPFGFRLCVPPYPKYDKSVGSISVFAPGLKENGSVFCHTNPWVVLAEAALGRGRRAYDAFRRISPYTKNGIQSLHGAEPYVVSQTIAMPPNRQAGRAMNPWLTGTASWLDLAVAEGILGIQPSYAGLRIDPCVPGWERFDVERVFRGARYAVSVHNPGRVEKGVRSVVVNGKRIDGNVVPPPKRGTRRVRVEVTMG